MKTMNEDIFLRQLAKACREDQPPLCPDVSDRVLRRVGTLSETSDRMLWTFTGCVCVAAAVVVIVALLLATQQSDPLGEYLDSMSSVIS